MSDADAFLDAIFAAPDDDLPRLVYADWLEEHGQQAYAEFIRLKCRTWRASLPIKHRRNIRQRQHTLLDTIIADNPEAFAGVTVTLQDFPRGLCEKLTVAAPVYCQVSGHWQPIFCPRQVTIYAAPGYEAAIVQTGYLARIRSLTVLSRPSSDMDDFDENRFPPLSGRIFTDLATSPKTASLKSLRVTIARASEPCLRAFAESNLCAQLEEAHVQFECSVGGVWHLIEVTQEPNEFLLQESLLELLSFHSEDFTRNG